MKAIVDRYIRKEEAVLSQAERDFEEHDNIEDMHQIDYSEYAISILRSIKAELEKGDE